MAQTFLSVESLNGEFVLILTPFTSVLSNIYMRDPDPDPQSSWIQIQYGSGSTTLVGTVST